VCFEYLLYQVFSHKTSYIFDWIFFDQLFKVLNRSYL